MKIKRKFVQRPKTFLVRWGEKAGGPADTNVLRVQCMEKSTSHLGDCLVGACTGNMHILRREVTDLRGVAEVTFHAGSLPCLLYHTSVRCVKSEVVSVGSAGNSPCK